MIHAAPSPHCWNCDGSVSRRSTQKKEDQGPNKTQARDPLGEIKLADDREARLCDPKSEAPRRSEAS